MGQKPAVASSHSHPSASVAAADLVKKNGQHNHLRPCQSIYLSACFLETLGMSDIVEDWQAKMRDLIDYRQARYSGPQQTSARSRSALGKLGEVHLGFDRNGYRSAPVTPVAGVFYHYGRGTHAELPIEVDLDGYCGCSTDDSHDLVFHLW